MFLCGKTGYFKDANFFLVNQIEFKLTSFQPWSQGEGRIWQNFHKVGLEEDNIVMKVLK